jgi:dTDP-4-dehydrorhamnose reductase
MKLLLLGNNGQLGWELQRTLQPLGEVVALDYPEFNMADVTGIRKTIQEYLPQVIVNATAYTAVDKAELEPELAQAINGIGPGVLAEEARKLNAVLVHYSTDYVFDGFKGVTYGENDLPNPVNVYGQSKLAGEQAIQSAGGDHLIFRTAWVYSLRRESFVTKVLGWARENELLRVVDDQVSNPTWARMLAEVTALVLAHDVGYLHERTGLYHLAGRGHISRYGWAQEIIRLDPKKQEQKVKQLLPALTSNFPTRAQRPLFSALECHKFEQAFDLGLPVWNTALELAFDSIVEG